MEIPSQEEILNMGMMLSSTTTNSSEASNYTFANFTECRALYEDLSIHAGYVGPVYDPSGVEDYLHGLDRSSDVNFTRLEYEFEETSYWNGILSTYPIVFSIIMAIISGILTVELTLRWTNRRYREWRHDFVKKYSAMEDPNSVDEEKIVEVSFSVFCFQTLIMFAKDSVCGRAPVWLRRLFCWFYVLAGVMLVVTAWSYLETGATALNDGINDSTEGVTPHPLLPPITSLSLS
ncbi:hypothetical protein CYMTET_35233 [Cymbomonas tetramitiformis]|uniref:Uncharacterized protein n=1 Tax=Cymbomonas tetramitiformis TaxID=36881 RepID=A0AAE0F9H2_9CHLO|nr:hypothetical protein CYMTET_35233 [Cymbomonas tetramitiformis]